MECVVCVTVVLRPFTARQDLTNHTEKSILNPGLSCEAAPAGSSAAPGFGRKRKHSQRWANALFCPGCCFPQEGVPPLDSPPSRQAPSTRSPSLPHPPSPCSAPSSPSLLPGTLNHQGHFEMGTFPARADGRVTWNSLSDSSVPLGGPNANTQWHSIQQSRLPGMDLKKIIRQEKKTICMEIFVIGALIIRSWK